MSEEIIRATHAAGVLIWKLGLPYLQITLPGELGVQEHSICEMLQRYTDKKMSLLFRNEEIEVKRDDDSLQLDEERLVIADLIRQGKVEIPRPTKTKRRKKHEQS